MKTFDSISVHGLKKQPKLKTSLLAIACASALTACGGGGSTASTDVQPTQQAAAQQSTPSKAESELENSASTVSVANGVKTTEQTTPVGKVTTVENVETTDSAKSSEGSDNSVSDSAVKTTNNDDGSLTVSGLDRVDEQSSSTTALGNCDSFQDTAAILKSINDIRATGRTCGSTFYPAAKPLKWNSQLTDAALNHATYMATTGEFSHTQTTSGMETIGKRATASGYNWMGVGENIASGSVSYQNVLAGWVKSAGHCANLMNPDYQDFGSACMTSTNDKIPTKWAQAFGKPKS